MAWYLVYQSPQNLFFGFKDKLAGANSNESNNTPAVSLPLIAALVFSLIIALVIAPTTILSFVA